MFSKLGDIQYIRGCSVHGGMFSTSGDIIMNVGDTMCTSGDVQYTREIPLVHWGGDIMSTLGDVQHIRAIS